MTERKQNLQSQIYYQLMRSLCKKRLKEIFCVDVYSSGQNKVPIEWSESTADINESVTVKLLTKPPVEQQLYGDFSKQLYFNFAYAPAAIGLGIPLDTRATTAPPNQSIEQLPVGFRFLFLPSSLEIALL